MQSVVFNMPVKDCKTQDNVTVTINLAICFRIKADPRKGEDPYLARNFVYKVTPRGLEQQLIDACEEATRKVARTLLHTSGRLRTDKSGKKMKVLKGAGDADAPPSELEGDAALRSVAGLRRRARRTRCRRGATSPTTCGARSTTSSTRRASRSPT